MPSSLRVARRGALVSPVFPPRLFGAFAAAGLLALAGCGPRDNDPGPGGVTVGEARALDEAASMLDKQRLPEDALESASDGPGNGAASGTAGEAAPATGVSSPPTESGATGGAAAR